MSKSKRSRSRGRRNAKEGEVSGRKNLDELIHGDRSIARSYREDWKGGSTNAQDDDYSNYGRYSSHGGSSYSSGSTTGSFHSCYHKHPPLKMPGTELVIYGGSCLSPIIKDADIYIGFDESMKFTKRSYPWNAGEEFLFAIRDMSVPDSPTQFGKLVDWTKAQLEAGKKVHCGCLGGHGRTGTFLAALVSRFGEKDAVTYVRKNYCKKAVESSKQIAFLKEHFGVLGAEPTKGGSYSTKWMPGKSGSKGGNVVSLPASSSDTFTHIAGNGCIWR